MRRDARQSRRATVLVMIVGLLATLFLIVTAYITLARFDKVTAASVRKSRTVEDILSNVNTLVVSTMRQSFADANGNLLSGGKSDPTKSDSAVLVTYGPVNIPGYPGTSWLAQLEPVRDAAKGVPGNALDPNWLSVMMVTPSVFGDAGVPNASLALALPTGTLIPKPPAFPAVAMLMGNDQYNGSNPPGVPSNLVPSILRNVRRPFMDATGAGVADASFAGSAALTELANAVADVAVRAPTYVNVYSSSTATKFPFNPNLIGNANTVVLNEPWGVLARQWRQYDENARYDVGWKVVDNGGMVALASPGTGTAWNREFVRAMFDWVRNRNDAAMRRNANVDRWMNQLAASAAQVEPLLRTRGGLVADYAEGNLGAAPPVLTELRNTFNKGTFETVCPNYRTDRAQRYNLASFDTTQADLKNEWYAWRMGATLDPDWANANWNNGLATEPDNGGGGYGSRNVRHLLTAISNSDDLSREADPVHPIAGLAGDLGLLPGQLKFYLGDIARAFNANGYFVPGDLVNNKRGTYIILRLANYYYDMLSDYSGTDAWQDAGQAVDNPSDTKWEAVSLRDQAIMLAVNTVAAAAPCVKDPDPNRNALGFVDSVYYVDNTSHKHYVGYAPQPFISQAIAYCEGGDPAGGVSYSVGVELYNPNDPDADADPTVAFDNPTDDFALDLGQFALSVNDSALVALDKCLPVVHRMTGRNFMSVVLPNGTTKLDNYCQFHPGFTIPPGTIHPVERTIGGSARRVMDVKLWRRGSDGNLRVIDVLTIGDDNTSDHQIPGLTAGGKEYEWLADYFRDTGDFVRGDALFGGDWVSAGGTPARWRTAIDFKRSNKVPKKDPDDAGPPPPPDIFVSGFAQWLGKPGALNYSTAGLPPFSPIVPLYTMNPRGNWPSGTAPWNTDLWRAFFTDNTVHGAYRPKAFPTVGFMLFVPRFASVTPITGLQQVPPPSALTTPMSVLLRYEWKNTKRKSSIVVNGTNSTYPADFGHMWIFDNHQPVRDGSYLDVDPTSTTKNDAQIPWGQLVFDYFTTIDPHADYDGDKQPDVDPLRIPGRININTAPWYVLAGLPVLSPAKSTVGTPGDLEQSLSPAFWSQNSGVLFGQTNGITVGGQPLQRFDARLLTLDLNGGSTTSWYRLGPYLAQAAAAYRDRIRYTSSTAQGGRNPFYGADERDATSSSTDVAFHYRKINTETIFDGYGYGEMRRQVTTNNGTVDARGFLSLGELVNVYGFESPYVPGGATSPTQILYRPLGRCAASGEPVHDPDFFKAVSLMALLDTEFLTTRSNTFTVYVSVMDRQNPQASIRSQLTVDRSNLLPKLVTDTMGEPIVENTHPSLPGLTPVVINNDALPEVVAQRQIGYFNTRFDH